MRFRLITVMCAIVGVVFAGGSAAFAASDVSPDQGSTSGGTLVSGAVPEMTFTQVSAGSNYSLGIGRDGNVYSWGFNVSGQLGDGTYTSSNVPVKVSQGDVPSGVTFTQVSAGSNYSLALGSDGNVYAWGDNSFGELGDDTTTNSKVPVKVSQGVVPAGVTFTQVSAGSGSSLALGSDGNVYSWGKNSSGQLGDGTNTNSKVPVKVSQGAVPSGVTFTQVSTGNGHSLGLGSDGNVYSWGDNNVATLGDGTTTNSNVPVKVSQGAVPSGVTFTQVSAGGNSSLALGSDGWVYAWGFNSYGELGDGTTTISKVPVKVSQGAVPAGVTFTQVSAGVGHSSALGSDGWFYTWGNNSYGRLGDGTSKDSNVPVKVSQGAVPAGVTFTQVSGGGNSLALGSDGWVYTWGDNSLGQLGDGTSKDSNVPVKVSQGDVPSQVTFTQVSAGYDHSLALGSDGWVYAWGTNWNRLGNGMNTNSAVPVRVSQGAVPAGVTFTQVSAGTNYSLALGSDGNVYSWGDNRFGELGDGTDTDSNVPVKVSQGFVPIGVTFTQVSAGDSHSLAIGNDGNAYSWGENMSGDLGDGTDNTSSKVPVKVLQGAVPEGVTFTQVSAGTNYSLALGSDGWVYAWGENSEGQLGDGNNIRSNVPVKVSQGDVPSGVKFTQLSSGSDNNSSLALGSDGWVYAWGYNSDGQLGDGTNTRSNVPVKVKQGDVPSGVKFTQFSAGTNYSLGIGSDGNAYSWGNNIYGQLGDGTNTPSNVPVKVSHGVVIDSVFFGNTKGADPSYDTSTKKWSVKTPAGLCGVQTVTVNWIFNGQTQPPLVYNDGFTFGSLPQVITQPKDTNVDYGSSTTLSASASGDPTPTVQWQSKKVSETQWLNIDGETSDSVKVSPKADTQYRAVYTNCVGSPVTTNTVKVNVNVAPSSPEGVTVYTEVNQIGVKWKAPSDDGGSPITGYVATVSPGGKSCKTDGSTLGCVISGLESGSYTVSVVAINSVGDSSPVSGPNFTVHDSPVFPVNVPVATGNVKVQTATGSGSVVSGSDFQVTVSGFAPNSNVSVAVYSTPTVLVNSYKVNGSGSGNITLEIPTSLHSGSHTLVVKGFIANGDPGYAVLPITVVAPNDTGKNVASDDTGKNINDGKLAFTGGNKNVVIWDVFAAMVLILSGVATIIVRRKKNVRK